MDESNFVALDHIFIGLTDVRDKVRMSLANRFMCARYHALAVAFALVEQSHRRSEFASPSKNCSVFMQHNPLMPTAVRANFLFSIDFHDESFAERFIRERLIAMNQLQRFISMHQFPRQIHICDSQEHRKPVKIREKMFSELHQDPRCGADRKECADIDARGGAIEEVLRKWQHQCCIDAEADCRVVKGRLMPRKYAPLPLQERWDGSRPLESSQPPPQYSLGYETYESLEENICRGCCLCMRCSREHSYPPTFVPRGSAFEVPYES